MGMTSSGSLTIYGHPANRVLCQHRGFFCRVSLGDYGEVGLFVVIHTSVPFLRNQVTEVMVFWGQSMVKSMMAQNTT